MSDLSEQQVLSTRRISRAWAGVAIFTGSIIITLVAIFALADWAEASVLHHAVQHVLIFTAGAGTGSSLLTTLKSKKEQ